jgi:hypothetical protein
MYGKNISGSIAKKEMMKYRINSWSAIFQNEKKKKRSK